MGVNDVIEMSNSKYNLAVTNYAISSIALIATIVLIVLLIKKKPKGITNFLRKFIPLLMFFLIVTASLPEGIYANVISNQLKKDSTNMTILNTSGKVEDTFAAAKTMFMIINTEKYIYREQELNTHISVGKEYEIKYLVNSKLVVGAEELKCSDDVN